MRGVVISIALLALAGASSAQARQSTLNMTCAEAAGLVAAQGAVVLSTGRHTYARFVSSGRFCERAEYAYRRRAPTRDGMCRIGYVCEPHRPLWLDDRDDFLRGGSFR